MTTILLSSLVTYFILSAIYVVYASIKYEAKIKSLQDEIEQERSTLKHVVEASDKFCALCSAVFFEGKQEDDDE